MISEKISVKSLLPYLADAGIAERISVFESLESTNTTARELAEQGAAHGTAVFANSQTAGRGRRGRSFSSPAGRGIYMSVVMRPQGLPAGAPGLLTAYAAVSVCEAIESVCGKTPAVKWVNDVLLNGRKICGISADAVSEEKDGGISWVVLGIGVNFSTRDTDFPKELRGIAGSVYPDRFPQTSINHLAAAILNNVLRHGSVSAPELILREYKRRMTLLGEAVTVLDTNGSYIATAMDIDSAGRLVVMTEGGELRALQTGEISVRPISH